MTFICIYDGAYIATEGDSIFIFGWNVHSLGYVRFTYMNCIGIFEGISTILWGNDFACLWDGYTVINVSSF